MKTIHALAASIALSFTLSAHALTQITGNELKSACDKHQNNSADVLLYAAKCMGYIDGAADGALFAFHMDKTPAPFCIPAGVTLNQAVSVVQKYLNEHPAYLHLEAAGLVAIALRDVFPCPDK